MAHKKRRQQIKSLSAVFRAAIVAVALGTPVAAQDMAFKQSVAAATYGSEHLASFYRDNAYQPIWTGDGPEFQARRAALIAAMRNTDVHGLPQGRYDTAALIEQMSQAKTRQDLAQVEVTLSRAFLKLARDLQSGILRPSDIDSEFMVRKVDRADPVATLTALMQAEPNAYMRSLAPASPQYRALQKEKINLEALLAQGGWGAGVPSGKLELGDEGQGVVALRNRLVAMGYMRPNAGREFDTAMQSAVQAFQAAHGLEQDGVAGPGTIEELNRSVSDRLKSVIVALERERWLPEERGTRHVLVNQTDFSAKIVDDGRITFETRAVIGKNTHDRQSPEFSDEMEHMVINPSWYVPRSIIGKEYLPKLQANPYAVSHLEITDRRGRVVNRGAVDFTQYSRRNFPFAMRQPPSTKNALGLVKFMFPNKYNIYLHDTPQKSLFARETRAFSHGCIRLAQPFDFAYALLAKQEEDPKAFFHRVLNTGRETKVDLEQNVPVHLIYRTAFVGADGKAQFRRDVYGRDAKIWNALNRAGVVLPGVQS
ncbi:L,D-transpeptidase family protein [Ruegeria sp. 2205SS24-7]|uniref:L,D-transpeptidase family protein n=1 Tax=Ruegeria discodermiae TaxID=3064389 RepID=UPI00274227B8|nr:L,D-transpeptidase family protein [Ruegeria sp. 2205SS24-7]MDP5216161.1 L,D-transpeptidase family protein [Ruegeria sp. 2205SS24-7]